MNDFVACQDGGVGKTGIDAEDRWFTFGGSYFCRCTFLPAAKEGKGLLHRRTAVDLLITNVLESMLSFGIRLCTCRLTSWGFDGQEVEELDLIVIFI